MTKTILATMLLLALPAVAAADTLPEQFVRSVGRASRAAATHRDQARLKKDLADAANETWTPWVQRLGAAGRDEEIRLLNETADDCDRLLAGEGGTDWGTLVAVTLAVLGFGLVCGFEMGVRTGRAAK